jgi:hypothetical protein
MSTKTPTKQSEQGTALAESDHLPLVRAKVVGKALGIHERTVALHAQNGTLPCYRIGAALRFDMTEVWAAVKGGSRA